MQPAWLVYSDRLYQALTGVYPASYRERFGREMVQVFRSLCVDVYRESGMSGLLGMWLAVIWDWWWAVITQWRACLFKGGIEPMETKTLDQRDAICPLPTGEAVLAVLPFLAFGVTSLVERLGFARAGSSGQPFWIVYWLNPYLIFNWLNLIGLGVGILAGFPRWGYSYLAWGLLFGWWWSDMSFYGYSVDLKIWLPFFGVFLICLLIRRSLAPLRAIFRGMWHEWTLFSLAVYTLYSFAFMIFDENHHPQLYLLMAMTILTVGAGTWGYFRAGTPLRRVLALIGGLAVAMAISEYSYATWDYRAYYNLSPSTEKVNVVGIIMVGVLLLIMLGNGLLARWRTRKASTSGLKP